MGSYYCRGRVTPAEGRSPDPIQARKGSTGQVIDDESTNTARTAEKVQTTLQTKAKTEPVARRLEMLREEFGVGNYLPRPLVRLIAVPHWTTKHWVPPKPGRVSIDTRLQRRPKVVR
jgi:hypothetical protein